MNANGKIEESSKRHILTVLLEDYFQVEAFSHLIERGRHYRFQTRYEQNTLKTLDLLDRFQIKATFFVLGCIAEENPSIVREVAARGHEIASRGFYHRASSGMSAEEFRADLRRAQTALERASGAQVRGYRAAHKWTDEANDWALKILAEEDYAYDASIMPTSRAVKANPESRFAHEIDFDGKRIWEFPVSTFQLPSKHLLPIGGGNYMRQFPHALVRRAVRHWTENYSAPFILYFHVWELDPVQPRIASADALTRVRHYRNLNKMAWVLDDYFRHYKFTSIADYLNLKIERTHENVAENARESLHVSTSNLPAQSCDEPRAIRNQTPITVIVPCFNEQLILPYLANTLRSVEAKLSDEYAVNFVFVDDCSTDETWTLLQQLFGSRANCQLVRHDANKGVAAAIMTGARAAQTEIVCSIDCDCTYDPHELKNMIPLLADDVEMVTASPYHPQGAVLNVPAWRLKLSKISSFLYRQVLRQKLCTYTSCFRVYRRRALLDLQIEKGGFLGIAEMLGKLDLCGGKIAEFPATLEVRLFGQSKMRVARTIVGHLGLLARLLVLRWKQERALAAYEEQQAAADYQNSPLVKERK
jgi:polysaccharide deacetylase family protein (PEP-CTERM system associated)